MPRAPARGQRGAGPAASHLARRVLWGSRMQTGHRFGTLALTLASLLTACSYVDEWLDLTLDGAPQVGIGDFVTIERVAAMTPSMRGLIVRHAADGAGAMGDDAGAWNLRIDLDPELPPGRYTLAGATTIDLDETALVPSFDGATFRFDADADDADGVQGVWIWEDDCACALADQPLRTVRGTLDVEVERGRRFGVLEVEVQEAEHILSANARFRIDG